jgi:peptidyl-prolyl cis-trans isomerase A (cyclophilin A)
MVTYAMAGPDTRTTQLFINYRDNKGLDGQGFAPFGVVVEGLAVVDSLYSGYGEGAPRGMGPDQGRAQAEGNAYLRGSFPKMDFVKTARVLKP